MSRVRRRESLSVLSACIAANNLGVDRVHVIIAEPRVPDVGMDRLGFFWSYYDIPAFGPVDSP